MRSAYYNNNSYYENINNDSEEKTGNLKNDRGSDEPKCIFTNSRVPNDDHFLKGLCVLIWRERETTLVIHG